MRVAIDIRPLLDEQPSGIRTYTTEIVRALLRIAPEHEYILFYNAARPVALPDLGAHTRVARFHYPNKLFHMSQWGLSWPRWDHLLAADRFFSPGLRLVPLSGQVPLIATVHDLSFVLFPEFYSRRRRVWHAMMRPRQFFQSADHLLAVSQSTARDVHDVYGVPKKSITVVLSGVEAVKEIPSRNEQQRVRRAWRLPDRFVLFLGTLEPRKNVPSVIRAFDLVAAEIPHHLVVAGARGWLTDEIDQARQHARHRARIHFPGVVPEADKLALLAAAELFVYPSFYEGFGFPPLEALLAGTPVVVSRNSSLPEIVGEWATLVEPAQPMQLAMVMRELLRDVPVVPESVRRAIMEKYSWDRAARETLQAIIAGG